MASRIIIGGREVGGGRTGGEAQCLCGQPAAILGRCIACHDALQRRRRGLPPNDAAEKKRLDAFMQKYQAAHQRCHECGATSADRDHDPRCRYYGL